MEIKSLVLIGVFCIIVSIVLYFYVYMGDLMDRIREFQKDMLFTAATTDDLKKIDENIKKDLDAQIEKEKAEKELAQVKQELEDIKKNMDEPKEEVFLVRNNLFSQAEAPKVCKGLFNSKAATEDQLLDGYNNGANWCNYGWTDDGQALYPLQEDTDITTCSGKKGLNGGKLEKDTYKLGTLCYGVKPEETKYTDLEKIYQDSAFAEDDIKMLENYRKKLAVGGIKIAAFNDKAWSQWSYKNDTMKVNDTTVVSSTKDSSKDPNSTKPKGQKIEAFIPGY